MKEQLCTTKSGTLRMPATDGLTDDHGVWGTLLKIAWQFAGVHFIVGIHCGYNVRVRECLW